MRDRFRFMYFIMNLWNEIGKIAFYFVCFCVVIREWDEATLDACWRDEKICVCCIVLCDIFFSLSSPTSSASINGRSSNGSKNSLDNYTMCEVHMMKMSVFPFKYMRTPSKRYRKCMHFPALYLNAYYTSFWLVVMFATPIFQNFSNSTQLNSYGTMTTMTTTEDRERQRCWFAYM